MNFINFCGFYGLFGAYLCVQIQFQYWIIKWKFCWGILSEKNPGIYDL